MQLDPYFYNYLFLGVFALVAVLFPLLPIILAKYIAPLKPYPMKNASYECGIESKGDAWIQFHAQYYLYALLFVIFDIETIFSYPWAVAYKSLGLFALIAMFLFLAILSIVLVYAWRKGVFEWK
jgi:NADH:ubiquinone oxidoreductase subunit 3 (subunit A)